MSCAFSLLGGGTVLCTKPAHSFALFSFWWHSRLCQVTLITLKSYKLLEIELIVDLSL